MYTNTTDSDWAEYYVQLLKHNKYLHKHFHLVPKISVLKRQNIQTDFVLNIPFINRQLYLIHVQITTIGKVAGTRGKSKENNKQSEEYLLGRKHYFYYLENFSVCYIINKH